MRRSVASVASMASVLLVAASGCLAGSDEGPPREAPPAPEPFAFSGTGCTELALFVPVDAPSVRGYVPQSYAVVGEASGRALLSVYLVRCEELTVDDQSAPTFVSGAGAVIESPDGSDGLHFYETWVVTSHEELRERYAALGMLGGLVTDMTLDASGATPLTTDIVGSVPWGDSAYELSATATALVPAENQFASAWWHTSEGVTERTTYDVAGTVPSAAVGEVRTETHTPLGHMLGGESGRGEGVYVTFGFEARVDVVDA